MPIYAYRCGTCGHRQDILQKLSDPVLSTCPACGAEAFTKQVTAAGFQLKGSGWYVTDFRGDNKARNAEDKTDDKPAEGQAKPDAKVDAKAADAKPDVKTEAKPAEAAPAPAPATPVAPPAASGS